MFIPGGKSGLSLIGVIGPGIVDKGVCLQTLRKHYIVGLISGCELISKGIWRSNIHGSDLRGRFVKDASSLTQSLVDVCTCQSIILVKCIAF